jgi:hypothetical protein
MQSLSYEFSSIILKLDFPYVCTVSILVVSKQSGVEGRVSTTIDSVVLITI